MQCTKRCLLRAISRHPCGCVTKTLNSHQRRNAASARLLQQIATTGGTLAASRLTEAFGRRRIELKLGTILMREWNAQAYRVMVLDEGFALNGKTYDYR
jgi:hypothetical protein